MCLSYGSFLQTPRERFPILRSWEGFGVFLFFSAFWAFSFGIGTSKIFFPPNRPQKFPKAPCGARRCIRCLRRRFFLFFSRPPPEKTAPFYLRWQDFINKPQTKVADREQTSRPYDQYALSDNLELWNVRPRPWATTVANVHLVLRPSTGYPLCIDGRKAARPATPPPLQPQHEHHPECLCCGQRPWKSPHRCRIITAK